MIIRKSHFIEFHLRLSVKEANWLKSILQNPLTDDECQEDKELREAFWTAIDESIKSRHESIFKGPTE